MSDHGKSAGHGQASSSDEADYGAVVKVGVASLALFAASILWAGWLYNRKVDEAHAKTGVAKVVDVNRKEIGIVDQVPFVVDHRLPKWQAERRAHLAGYGWVDRSKGLAHIPIDKAVDQIIAGGAPAGAPK